MSQNSLLETTETVILLFQSIHFTSFSFFFFSLVFVPDTLIQPDLFISPESDGGGTSANAILFVFMLIN